MKQSGASRRMPRAESATGRRVCPADPGRSAFRLNAVCENTTTNKTKIPSAMGTSMIRRRLKGTFLRSDLDDGTVVLFRAIPDIGRCSEYYRRLIGLGPVEVFRPLAMAGCR